MKERDLMPAWPFLSFDPSIKTLDGNENENAKENWQRIAFKSLLQVVKFIF